MYRKMLVPLDGSELAEVVFTYAKELAGRLDIDVILLHVVNPVLQGFTPMHRAYIEHAAEILQREARSVQERSKGAKPQVKPVETRSELTVGYAPDEILRCAEKNKVDLILMASHGRSGLRRWTMGSVADKILRTSQIPVWLVRAGVPDEILYDKWPKKTILVPLDGSELAESVLPHVQTLSEQRGPERVDVVLVRVCEPPAVPSYYAPELPDAPLNWGEYMQKETARCKQTATDYLAEVAKKLKAMGVNNVKSEVLVGKSADQLVDYANKNPFNLIVMATHGRSGLSRWVYGSITENVLQGVSCPILLIRTNPSNQPVKKEK